MKDRTKIHSFIQQKFIVNITVDKKVSIMLSL